MIKSFASGWLTRTFIAVLLSPWTLGVLVSCSWVLCSVSGWQAFGVWCMAFSGALLMGVSELLGYTQYRFDLLNPPRSFFGRHATFIAWFCWIVGLLLMALTLIFSVSIFYLWFVLAGILCAGLLCLQVRDHGGMTWIR